MCGITYNEVRGAKQSRDVMMELREGHNPGKRYKYVTQKKSKTIFWEKLRTGPQKRKYGLFATKIVIYRNSC